MPLAHYIARPLQRALLATVFALVLLCLGSGLAMAQEPPRYEIALKLDLDSGRAAVQQNVEYRNDTGATLNSLVFHVTAAYYDAFSLNHATVAGQSVQPSLHGIVLELPLPQPLAAGQSVQARLDYQLQVPQPGKLRFGHSAGIIALGNWYPALAVYRQGPLTYDGALPRGWDRHQHGTPSQLANGIEPGDGFFTEAADFVVELEMSRPALVAHSGNGVGLSPTKLRLTAEGARDFALAISDRYKMVSRQVGPTEVVAYYLPEHEAGGQEYLRAAVNSVQWLNDNIGVYPNRTIRVAETTSNDLAWVGQEYADVVFISSQQTTGAVGLSSYLHYLVVHEVIHQWFYNQVGNDQIYEPWLDEALTTHLSYRVLEEEDGSLGVYTWSNLAQRRADDAAVYPDFDLNTSIYDYADESHYFAIIYRKGAAFLEEVRSLIGDSAYLRVLSDYYTRYQGRIAMGTDLLSLLRQEAGPALDDLITRNFSYQLPLPAPRSFATPTPAPTPTATPSPVPTSGVTPTPTAAPSAPAPTDDSGDYDLHSFQTSVAAALAAAAAAVGITALGYHLSQ